MRRRIWLAGTIALGLTAAGLVAPTVAQAATGCRVSYTVTNQWPGGFGTNVNVTNLGDPIDGWHLEWTFAAGQTVTQLWNGSYTQSGGRVTVTNAAWNGRIGTGDSTGFGFNGSWNNSSNPVPSSFALNGVTCTGNVTSPPSSSPTPPSSPSPSPSASPTRSPSASPSPTATGGSLPNSFQWSSSGPLIAPKSDATHSIDGIKDPSVVYYDGTWHVFASVANASGYGLVTLSFTDWSQAGSAPQYYLDQSGIGGGYRAAPEVFYFAPQHLWYLVYQTGNASYSTNPDINDPSGWSAPKNFYPSMPSIISQNIGSGYWVDMWVICDDTNCYLFSSDDNGHLYRSQTTVADFPNGMSDPVIAAQDTNKYALFEASNVYKVQGSNQYLLIVEAIGSDGRRYFRSWTSSSIAGTWNPLAASESNPFARASNVTFNGTPWTEDISHGEMLRAGYDQTLTISPCHMRYLYQGKDPDANDSYNSLPWRLGLLTQTNSTC